MSTSPSVFISCDRSDSELARYLSEELRKDGLEVYLDVDSLRPGANFVRQLETELNRASVIVLLLSSKASVSNYVRDEVAISLRRKKFILPVLLDGGALNTPLTSLVGDRTMLDASQLSPAKTIDSIRENLLHSLPSDFVPKSEEPPLPKPVRASSLLVRRSIVVALMVIAFFGAISIWYSRLMDFAPPDGVDNSRPHAIPTGEVPPRHSIDAPLTPTMITIPSGCFLMGSPEYEKGRYSDEGPVHKTCIQAFAISRHEVTFDEYDRFAVETGTRSPYDEGWGRGTRPVVNVSWNDATDYVRWLSQRTGKKYRLPTEAEWEYAVRAGTQTAYWWGDVVQEAGEVMANCNGCGSEWDNKMTAPVGSFPANSFGIYDTAGNVWEWTQDCWHSSYVGAPVDGSAWSEAEEGGCSDRTIRGGAWLSAPPQLRSAVRTRSAPQTRSNALGFRIVEEL